LALADGKDIITLVYPIENPQHAWQPSRDDRHAISHTTAGAGYTGFLDVFEGGSSEQSCMRDSGQGLHGHGRWRNYHRAKLD
jgi:hypothetical protein